MRILTAYYTHKPGGFCKRLYRMIEALQSRGHSVQYCCLDRPPVDLSGAAWVRIPFPLRARDGLLFWSLFAAWLPIWLIFRAVRSRPDRYVVFGATYAAMLQPARIIHRRSVVLFLRSLPFEINRLKGTSAAVLSAADMLERIGMWGATHVICMTNAMKRSAEQFLRRPFRSASILPNDLPPVSPEHTAEVRRIILTAGVLDRRKNVGLLIEAWRMAECPNFVLQVAGEGSELPILQRQAPDSVQWLGWVDRLQSVWVGVALLVHPALHEGVPNVVLEALANEVPILVARIPELQEFVDDDLLCFDPHGSAELARKLTSFATDEAYRSDIINRSRAVATRYSFDWEKAVVEVIEEAG